MTATEAASGDKVLIRPLPDWVVTHKVKNRQAVEGEPITDLLFERQVHEELRTVFLRTVYRVENSVGVDQCSQLSIGFSPERNRLTVHRIQIFRDGGLYDRTEEGDFKIIQREADLESSLSFNGELTAVKMLYDIRVGDVIDYSYSIESIDPIYADGMSQLFFSEDTIPLGLRYVSWMTANPDGLSVRGDYTLEDAEHEEVEGLHRYTWCFHFDEVGKVDNSIPRGMLALKHIEISSYSSFQEIASLEQREWSKDQSFDWEFVRNLIGFDECESDREKIEKAIWWVLDNIRYQGIFVGSLALVPAPLAEVLKRRFGDCKENTALLVAILRSLGYEAWPAIVSSLQGEHIKERLISPAIFDHAIACLKFEGELYWIDATDSFVGRKLERFRRSHFGVALILSPESDSLTEIPSYRRGDSELTVDTTARLSSRGRGGSLESTLVAKGLAAERIKRNFSNQGVKGFKEGIQDELRNKFPEIEIVGEIEVLKSENDHFSMSYRAEGEALSFYSEVDRCHIFPLEAPRIAGGFSLSESGDRRFPLALSFPCTITERFEIHNKRFRPEQPDPVNVVTPYFQASKTFRASNGMLEATFLYENLAPEIPVSAFPEMHKKLEEAANLVAGVDALYVDSREPFKKSGVGFAPKRRTDGSEPTRRRRSQQSTHPGSDGVETQTRRRSRASSGSTRLSGMALTSLICGITGCLFVVPFILAIIFGHIALTKIKYDHTLTGRGMAIMGLILGYLILGVLLFFMLVGAIGGMNQVD